jgi:transposase-like protein
MKKADFSALLTQIDTLSVKQKAMLVSALDPTGEFESQPSELIDKELSVKPVCPHCSSGSVYKWGMVSGLQRYRCKECKRTFNALSGTPMSRLRKKELWFEYSQALADSLSLTKAAERCGIDRTTAFRWRHRFLPQSGGQSATCTGITEIDETYFRESFKGKKVLHRKPRKRGKLEVRGLSSEQIAVVVAKDRVGHVCDGVLQERTAKEIAFRIGAHIAPDSLLCIEKSRILLKFAKDAGLAFEAIGTKQRKGREKVFHVQTVNAYHSRLKNWMARFNGVATERLPNYLCWRRLQETQLASSQDWLLAMVKEKLHIKRN